MDIGDDQIVCGFLKASTGLSDCFDRIDSVCVFRERTGDGEAQSLVIFDE